MATEYLDGVRLRPGSVVGQRLPAARPWKADYRHILAKRDYLGGSSLPCRKKAFMLHSSMRARRQRPQSSEAVGGARRRCASYSG